MRRKLALLALLLFMLGCLVPVYAREINEEEKDTIAAILLVNETLSDAVVVAKLANENLSDAEFELANISDEFYEFYTRLADIERSLRLERVRSDVAVDYAFNQLSLMLSNQLLLIDVLETMILDLQGQLDLQEVYIVELGEELYRQRQELMIERASRNNITIMFGVFSAVVILLIARRRKW